MVIIVPPSNMVTEKRAVLEGNTHPVLPPSFIRDERDACQDHPGQGVANAREISARVKRLKSEMIWRKWSLPICFALRQPAHKPGSILIPNG